MFDLVPSHPVATDSAFQHLTQLTMMMMMMVVVIMTMTLTMMTMTLMVLMITLTPDAAHEATVPALTVDRPSQKPLFAVGPRCKF